MSAMWPEIRLYDIVNSEMHATAPRTAPKWGSNMLGADTLVPIIVVLIKSIYLTEYNSHGEGPTLRTGY